MVASYPLLFTFLGIKKTNRRARLAKIMRSKKKVVIPASMDSIPQFEKDNVTNRFRFGAFNE